MVKSTDNILNIEPIEIASFVPSVKEIISSSADAVVDVIQLPLYQ